LETEKLKEDYGKLVEAPELADVVLVVEGERFPAHRNVLAARSEYFRGLLLSGMQEGSGQQEIALGEVSAGGFRVVLRYLYTAAMPAWEELKGTGTSAEDWGGAADDTAAERTALELEVLMAADLFQAEGLLKHCLEGFRGALTVHTVVEQLVWAHKHGPAEARAIAVEYFVAHLRAVRVRACCACLGVTRRVCSASGIYADGVAVLGVGRRGRRGRRWICSRRCR
jgi:hypothetical protein